MHAGERDELEGQGQANVGVKRKRTAVKDITELAATKAGRMKGFNTHHSKVNERSKAMALCSGADFVYISRDPNGGIRILCTSGAGALFVQWVDAINLFEAASHKANYDKELANRMDVPAEGFSYFGIHAQRVVVKQVLAHLIPKHKKDFPYKKEDVTAIVKAAHPWWPDGVDYKSPKEMTGPELKAVFDGAAVGANDVNAVTAAIKCCGVGPMDMQMLLNITIHGVYCPYIYRNLHRPGRLYIMYSWWELND
jgi:hypothetical protein